MIREEVYCWEEVRVRKMRREKGVVRRGCVMSCGGWHADGYDDPQHVGAPCGNKYGHDMKDD